MVPYENGGVVMSIWLSHTESYKPLKSSVGFAIKLTHRDRLGRVTTYWVHKLYTSLTGIKIKASQEHLHEDRQEIWYIYSMPSCELVAIATYSTFGIQLISQMNKEQAEGWKSLAGAFDERVEDPKLEKED